MWPNKMLKTGIKHYEFLFSINFEGKFGCVFLRMDFVDDKVGSQSQTIEDRGAVEGFGVAIVFFHLLFSDVRSL